jgi:protein O-mannosyl-transferase
MKPKSKKSKEEFLNKTQNQFIILILVIIAVYSQVISFSYTGFDDDFLIFNNQKLNDIENINKIFTENSFLTNAVFGFYRPIQTLSFIIDSNIANGDLMIFHLSNLLLHIIACCLLLTVLKKMKLDPFISFLFTLIFAVHPLLSINLGWLPARGDLLITVFSLISFIVFIKYLDTNKIQYLIIHCLVLLLAFFSKETAVLFPLLILLYIILEKRKLFSNEMITVYILWGTSWVIWYLLRAGSVNELPDNQIFGLIPFMENLRTIPELISKSIIPYGLMPLPVFRDEITIIGMILIFLIVIFAIFKKQKNTSLLIFGSVWFIILILPGMFYSRFYPKSELFYHYLDHRAYLPLIGLIMVFISVFSNSLQKINKRRITITAFILTAVFSVISFNYVKTFANPENFFEKAIDTNPGASVAYFLRGNYYKDIGEINKAINDYSNALKIDSTDADVFNNRGSLFAMTGKNEEALDDLNKAIKLKPAVNDGYFNRGLVKDALGDFKGAINDYSIALTNNRNDAYTYYLRGNSYSSIGMMNEAVNDFNFAIKLKPDFRDAYVNRGIERYKLGDYKGACSDWQTASQMGSDAAMKMMKKYCK